MKSKEKSMMKEIKVKESESQYFKPKTGRPPENRSSIDAFTNLYNLSAHQA
jgi:hypothetical protein